MHSRGAFAVYAAVLPVLLAVSGCSVGPKYNAPQVSLNAKYREGAGLPNGDVASRTWWTAFGDSRLDGLVTQGVSENLDLRQALERINSARLNVDAAGAGSLPSLTASANGNLLRQQTEGSSSAYRETSGQGSLQASWLLDFFGTYRRSRESAVAKLGEAEATADQVRLSLLSQVVSAYVDLRFYQRRLAIARQDLAARRETLALTRSLFKAGQGTKLDVTQAEGAVSTAATTIPGLEIEVRRAAHRIATLLGLPAGDLMAELERDAVQPVSRRAVDAGVPTDLIRNRPDIHAAERRLASATAEIGVAEAQLYPSITLGGTITPNYTAIAGGLNSRTLTWSFGPTLNLPIFDGGRLRANLGIAESSAAEAYLAWKATVLKSIEEVENALAAVNRDARTILSARDAVRAYRQSVNMATKRYEQGETSLFEVLDVQKSLSGAEADLADAIRTMALNYVELNRAIGSGYRYPAKPASSTAEIAQSDN